MVGEIEAVGVRIFRIASRRKYARMSAIRLTLGVSVEAGLLESWLLESWLGWIARLWWIAWLLRGIAALRGIARLGRIAYLRGIALVWLVRVALLIALAVALTVTWLRHRWLESNLSID